MRNQNGGEELEGNEKDIMIELKSPSSIEFPIQDSIEFQFFLQLMVNRRAVGQLRYGAPKRSQKYLTRLRKEVKAYIANGNQEQLINIAVYAFLEWIAPEHPRAYFDPTADSVTRGKV